MNNYIKILQSFISIKDENKVSIIPINDGHINTTLRVDINDNDTQQYILQKINHHIFRKPEVIMHSIDVVTSISSQQDMNMKFLKLSLI